MDRAIFNALFAAVLAGSVMLGGDATAAGQEQKEAHAGPEKAAAGGAHMERMMDAMMEEMRSCMQERMRAAGGDGRDRAMGEDGMRAHMMGMMQRCMKAMNAQDHQRTHGGAAHGDEPSGHAHGQGGHGH